MEEGILIKKRKAIKKRTTESGADKGAAKVNKNIEKQPEKGGNRKYIGSNMKKNMAP